MASQTRDFSISAAPAAAGTNQGATASYFHRYGDHDRVGTATDAVGEPATARNFCGLRAGPDHFGETARR